MSARRIGILGGTFDPVHAGHLDVACAALDGLGLDRVLLLPSAHPPHRAHRPQASGYHRFAMVTLACQDHERLAGSDDELRAGEVSYTSDTLRRMHTTGYAPDELFFITGADAFAEIATWRDYPALLALAHFIVVSRPGHPAATMRQILPELADSMIEVSPIGSTSPSVIPQTARGERLPILLLDARTSSASSTEIRRRLATGGSVDSLVPNAVASHIHKHGLYKIDKASHLHGQD